MTAIQTPKSLTEAQIRLLRLFSVMSSNESDEIIGLVQTHLQQKLNRELDRVSRCAILDVRCESM